LEQAPIEHAEAVLAAFEVLQGLHDRGLLDLLRGALGAGDQLLETVVETARTPEGMRALRNLICLSRLLGSIEPERLQRLIQGIPDDLARATAEGERKIGLWTLFRRIRGRDALRGLAAVLDLLEGFGRRLHSSKNPK
jgi:uncharacterized protein YjgD (DUF1641 family)